MPMAAVEKGRRRGMDLFCRQDEGVKEREKLG